MYSLVSFRLSHFLYLISPVSFVLLNLSFELTNDDLDRPSVLLGVMERRDEELSWDL